MKHSITLTLQQIKDLRVICYHIISRENKAYLDASNHAFAAGEHRATAEKEKNAAKRVVLLKEAAALEAKADKLNAECDRLMAHANLIQYILTQIEKNG